MMTRAILRSGQDPKLCVYCNSDNIHYLSTADQEIVLCEDCEQIYLTGE
jgi:hypothetical protein